MVDNAPWKRYGVDRRPGQGKGRTKGMPPPARGGHEGVGSSAMATILAADYGRDDFLALGSPLVSTLRAWGYEVVEAENSLDVLQQASRVHPDAVVLYDTLPALEALCAALHQHVATQGIPILILHEQVQQMRFTDMVMIDPQYRLGKSPRQFDPQELRRLLEQVCA
jgi:CheY-like chemotaxis protein